MSRRLAALVASGLFALGLWAAIRLGQTHQPPPVTVSIPVGTTTVTSTLVQSTTVLQPTTVTVAPTTAPPPATTTVAAPQP